MGCGSAPLGTDPNPQDANLLALSCSADVATAAMRCVDATPGVHPMSAGPITVGGQGVNVLLVSNSVGYNSGTQIFTASVTLKNLAAQPLGTSDGANADPAGIQVFFSSSPSVTGGTGTAAVANPDGTGNFTDLAQPYFKYPGNLAGGATSGAKTWNFTVSPSVTAFHFQVFVTAQVPQSSGILRWLRDSLESNASFYNAWGTSATNAYVVGLTVVSELSGSELLNWNGSGWTKVKSFTPDLMFGIGGFGSTLVATGSAGVIYYTPDVGAHWTRVVANSGGPLLQSAWASSATDLYTAGSAGKVYRSTNGTSWTAVSTPTTSFLYHLWGTSASDIFAVGTNGAVLHSVDGATWTQGTIPGGLSTTTFFGVGGVGGGPFFAVGAGGAILISSNDGASWSSVASGTTKNLNAVSCASATDCVAVGDLGTAVVWNGSAWSLMTSGTTQHLRGIWGASDVAVFAAGDSGTILRGVR